MPLDGQPSAFDHSSALFSRISSARAEAGHAEAGGFSQPPRLAREVGEAAAQADPLTLAPS